MAPRQPHAQQQRNDRMGRKRGRFSGSRFGISAFAELKSARSCKTPRLSDTPQWAEQPPIWKEKDPWDTIRWISVCNSRDTSVRDSAGPVGGPPVGPSRSRPKGPGEPVRMAETVLRCSGETCWETGGTFPSSSIFSRRVKGFLAVSWEKMRICKRRLALSPLRVKS